MTQNGSRSISVESLYELMNHLAALPYFSSRYITVDSMKSTHIRDYLVTGAQHPAQLFPEKFSQNEPNVALTYEWTLNLKDIFSYLNPVQVHNPLTFSSQMV